MRFRTLSPLLVSFLAALQIASCANDSNPIETPPTENPPVETPQSEGNGASGTITVNPEAKFQTIDGFGTTSGMFDNPHLNGSPNPAVGGLVISQAQRDTIYDLLYSPTKGIGLNRLRVHLVSPGWQPEEGAPIVTEAPIPGPQGPAVLDFIRRAKLRNPELRTGFQMGVYDRWIGRSTSPFTIARYIKSGLDYARAHDHEPDWVGIQNEPSLTPPGFSAEQLRDIAVALKRVLTDDGYTARLSIPDDVGDELGAPKAAVTLADPEARSFVKSLSIHLYGDLSPVMTAALARDHGLPLWMTEYGDRDRVPGNGWGLRIVHEMLVTYNAAAVDILFGFVGNRTSGAPAANYISLNSTGTVYEGYTINPSYYEVGHWSKYLTRGAVRIGAESSNPRVKVSAFLNAGKKVIVLIHTGDATESVSIPSGAYRLIRTQLSGTDRLTDKGLFQSTINLPSHSFTTLVER